MAISTSVLKFTPVFISLCIFLCFPTWTLCIIVFKRVWLSSEILPIMCIDALISLMIFLREWTPHCFEMKHVKINIMFHFVQKVYWQFIFIVCKSTNITIFALINFIRISWTKFRLVFFWMIKIFNSVVASNAVITLLTMISTTISHIKTHFRSIFVWLPSPILVTRFMKVQTLFWIVSSLIFAWLCFKKG